VQDLILNAAVGSVMRLPPAPKILPRNTQPSSSRTLAHGSKIPKMIDKALLEILVCPVCKTPLTEKTDALKCAKCRRVYPVRDNIPIMLIDQATVDPE
jgi:uncharacterized protein